jgi:hypothetical protein
VPFFPSPQRRFNTGPVPARPDEHINLIRQPGPPPDVRTLIRPGQQPISLPAWSRIRTIWERNLRPQMPLPFLRPMPGCKLIPPHAVVGDKVMKRIIRSPALLAFDNKQLAVGIHSPQITRPALVSDHRGIEPEDSGPPWKQFSKPPEPAKGVFFVNDGEASLAPAVFNWKFHLHPADDFT